MGDRIPPGLTPKPQTSSRPQQAGRFPFSGANNNNNNNNTTNPLTTAPEPLTVRSTQHERTKARPAMFHCTEHGTSGPYRNYCEVCEGPDETLPTTEEIRAAAEAAGAEAGYNSATWILDGNSTEADARAVIEAAENCELDMPNPLSGEHAGQSIPEIIHEAGLDYDALNTDEIHDHNDVDTFLDAYESAFFQAYETEAVRAARYQVEG